MMSCMMAVDCAYSYSREDHTGLEIYHNGIITLTNSSYLQLLP